MILPARYRAHLGWGNSADHFSRRRAERRVSDRERAILTLVVHGEMERATAAEMMKETRVEKIR